MVNSVHWRNPNHQSNTYIIDREVLRIMTAKMDSQVQSRKEQLIGDWKYLKMITHTMFSSNFVHSLNLETLANIRAIMKNNSTK